MGQPLSEKRRELARKYIESEGINEPVLEELNRLMKPLYYYCIGDYYKSLPLNDLDDFYQIGYVTLWKVLEKCRKKPDIINSFSSYMMTAVKHAYATEYRNYILKNPIVKVGYEPKGAGGYYYSSVFFNTQYRDRLNEKAREWKREFRKKNPELVRQREREYWHRNKEKKAAKDKRYYEKHKEQIRQRSKE